MSDQIKLTLETPAPSLTLDPFAEQAEEKAEEKNMLFQDSIASISAKNMLKKQLLLQSAENLKKTIQQSFMA